MLSSPRKTRKVSKNDSPSSVAQNVNLDPYDVLLDFLGKLDSRKADFTLAYYFVNADQNSRNSFLRAAHFLAIQSKSKSFTVAQINAQEDATDHGPTADGDAQHPHHLLLKTAKHICTLAHYVHETRAANGEYVAYISVDNSPFYPIL